MDHARPLAAISDDELLRRLVDLSRQSRRVESDLVAHIAEVELRRLYAREASPSMFVYCTQVLRLSEAESYARITVARASLQHPMLLDMLADGRVHLTGIARLVPHLTTANRAELLERTTHKSRRQIEELVAGIAPRPDVATLIRRLPGRSQLATPARPVGSEQALRGSGLLCPDRVELRPLILGPDHDKASVVAGQGTHEAIRESPMGFHSAAHGPVVVQSPAASQTPALGQALALGARAPAAHASRPAVVQPLGNARYKVQFTASAELRSKLERLRSLMRSQVPDGDLAVIIERAVSETLERLESRRFATTSRPRKGVGESDSSARSRRIPAAIRRAVYERDGGRCRYVDGTGRRCPARDRLEYHHRHPFGMGGDHGLSNIRLMCAAHNAYLAEHDYGQAAMARWSRSRTSALAPSLGASADRPTAPTGPGPWRPATGHRAAADGEELTGRADGGAASGGAGTDHC